MVFFFFFFLSEGNDVLAFLLRPWRHLEEPHFATLVIVAELERKWLEAALAVRHKVSSVSRFPRPDIKAIQLELNVPSFRFYLIYLLAER